MPRSGYDCTLGAAGSCADKRHRRSGPLANTPRAKSSNVERSTDVEDPEATPKASRSNGSVTTNPNIAHSMPNQAKAENAAARKMTGNTAFEPAPNLYLAFQRNNPAYSYGGFVPVQGAVGQEPRSSAEAAVGPLHHPGDYSQASTIPAATGGNPSSCNGNESVNDSCIGGNSQYPDPEDCSYPGSLSSWIPQYRQPGSNGLVTVQEADEDEDAVMRREKRGSGYTRR